METNTNGQEYVFYNGFLTSKWYYIVLTREENTVTYYQNGNYIGSSTITGADNLTISQIGFNGRSFNGSLDEIGIWNRVLTSADVSMLYNMGKGLGFPFRSLKSSEYDGAELTNNDLVSQKLIADESHFYPNPASELLYITHEYSQNALITIFDMQGKVILIQQLDGNAIDISGLKRGFYLVRIVDADNTSINRLIKE